MFTATQLVGFAAGTSSADPYGELVTLLLQSPTADSTTPIDYSQYKRTVSLNGNAALGGPSPWSGYQGYVLDGAGDYLSFADSDGWYFPGDLAIDLVLKLDGGSTSVTRDWLGQYADDNNFWLIENRAGVSQFKLQAAVSGSNATCSGAQITATGVFISVSIGRKGNVTKSFVSGGLYGSAANLAFANYAAPLWIGRALFASNSDLAATLAAVRITNGHDRGYIDGGAPDYVSIGPFAIP